MQFLSKKQIYTWFYKKKMIKCEKKNYAKNNFFVSLKSAGFNLTSCDL